MVDAATSIIHYKHISASLYSANSITAISFYHVLRQISIVLSHYVEIFLILACLGCGYLLGVADIGQLTVTADGPLISSQAQSGRLMPMEKHTLGRRVKSGQQRLAADRENFVFFSVLLTGCGSQIRRD